MEMQAFTEQGIPPENAPTQRNNRNNRFAWCLGTCLALWGLSLLAILTACMLSQPKQPCWFQASSPNHSQAAIHWTWIGNCSSSAMKPTEPSLEILESSVYFAYVYVACKENGCFENDFFTVQLTTHPNKPLSILKAPNATHSFVNFGRAYLLEKGTRLRLDINSGLKHVDIENIHWGVYKI